MEKQEVIWQIRAIRSLHRIEHLIALDKPEADIKFGEELRKVGDSLGDFSNFLPCRSSKIRHRNAKCFPYRENYIFVFRITNTSVIIMDIAHASRMK